MFLVVSDKAGRLELNHLSLPLLLSSQLKVFGSLDGMLVLPFALGALEPQHQLLGGLGLLPQDGLGLTTETLLFTVVPSPSLGLLRLSGLLILSHFEQLVRQAFRVGAVGLPELGNVHHTARLL